MKQAAALLLFAPIISLVGCHNIEDDAQRFRKVDFDPNGTYKMFEARFGTGVRSSCEGGVITTDCSVVSWPRSSTGLITAMFHAQSTTGFGTDWSIDEDAKAIWVDIDRHYLGKVCGEHFVFEEHTICGSTAKPLKNAYGTVTDLRWEAPNDDSGDPRATDDAIRGISGGLFTPMPPPQVFGSSGSGPPRLTIDNGTKYSIQLYLSGPETRSLTVLAGESSTFDLQAGAFKLAAETPDSSISPFYCEQTFNNGAAYLVKLSEVVRR